MASLTPSKLPILNFSSDDLKPGTTAWVSMTVEVRKALEEFGCFEAVYKVVPSEAHKRMNGAIEDLYNLPVHTKAKYVSKSNPECSYYGPTPSFPLFETMGIPNADAVESSLSFATLMWPDGNPTFSETIHSYVQQLMPLEQMIKKMTFESFGLERYCPSYESTDYNLRLIAYTPQKNETNGLSVHTDKSMFTILHQNQVDGLEVQTKNGEWFGASPSPSSFVVLIGDFLMAWSNGRLHCPIHRVTINGNDKRYSLALATYNKEITETPAELVDEEHPLLFKPFHYSDFMRFHMSGMEKLKNYTLKDYCGV